MNFIKRHKILTALVGLVIIIVLSLSVSHGGGGRTTKTTPPPASTAPAKPKSPAQSERGDLNSFRISDRSVSGLTDIWVAWSVTNHSSKASDYEIDWEALNTHGVRVASGEELTTNVQPGQTAKDSTPTTLDTAHVKLVITKFDRTQSFG
jgi:hypothetical protein